MSIVLELFHHLVRKAWGNSTKTLRETCPDRYKSCKKMLFKSYSVFTAGSCACFLCLFNSSTIKKYFPEFCYYAYY